MMVLKNMKEARRFLDLAKTHLGDACEECCLNKGPDAPPVTLYPKIASVHVKVMQIIEALDIYIAPEELKAGGGL